MTALAALLPIVVMLVVMAVMAVGSRSWIERALALMLMLLLIAALVLGFIEQLHTGMYP